MPTAPTHVAAEVVRPLRAAVLRPGLPADLSVYPGDDDPDTTHVAVRDRPDGPAVAVGSILPEAPPERVTTAMAASPSAPAPTAPGPGERWWRIRGMATAEGRRGEGLGRQVLDALLDAAAARGGGVVWCNARVPALAFYLRAGFETVGEVFVEPLIGPHQAMLRRTPRR